MLLSETVKIRVLNLLVNHYSKLGYENVKANQLLEIKIKDLSHGSNAIIEFQCDSCQNIFQVKYRLFKKNINGTTFCKKCRLSESAKKRIEKYGTSFSNPDVQKKIASKYSNDPDKKREIDGKRKSTRSIKYGNPNWNNQEKRIQTGREKGGDWTNSESRKKTLFIKYGNPNWNNQEKKRKTCLEKYGVEHTQQLDEVFSKTCKIQRFNENLTYQGSYELDFLQKYSDLINLEKPKSFFYIDDYGKRRKYFPDFYWKEANLIIEIKSAYTLKNDRNAYRKKNSVEIEGFNFIWIVDKKYTEFRDILTKYANSLDSALF